MSEITFGRWLKHERETMGLTQAELARQLACATITLRKIEADERRPAREIVEQLAEIFEFNLEQRAAFFKFARNGTLPSFFSAEPSARQFRTRVSTLPLAASPFFGRDAELETARGLLRDKRTRVLTFIGVGGIGKTRLALELADAVAETFADGVCFVDLAPLTNAALVPAAIAHVLGVRAYGAESVFDALKKNLRGKHLLLILDNFEQLVTAAPIASEILQAARRVKMIVTSRQPLHLNGEQILQVPPLPTPNPKRLPALRDFSEYTAVSLFLSHARTARADFLLNQDNARFVAKVCDALEGIPLALELAAARVRYFPIQEIASRLEQRFRLLRSDAAHLPARHQTLYATIEWSYDLLSEAERALFRRLAVFSGGWTLRAAEQVCAGEGLDASEVLHRLTQLADKSLITITLNADVARFRILETLRVYAHDKLIEAGEEIETRARHLEFFCALAETSEPRLRSNTQIEALAELEQEHDNFRAALDWCSRGDDKIEMGLRLATALARFWYLRGYWSEGRARLAELVSQFASWKSSVLYARALNWSATLARPQDDDDAARAFYQASLEVSKKLDDAGLEEYAYALRGLGGIANTQGEYEKANQLFATSADIFQKLEARWQYAYSTFGLAIEAYNLGDKHSSERWIEETLRIFREFGDRWGIAVALDFLGEVARTEGDDAKASAYYQEILSLRRALQDRQGIAVSLHALGHVSLHRQECADAKQSFTESMSQYRELGSPLGIANCLAGLGGVAGVCGEPHRAARLFGAAASILETTPSPTDPVDQRELERNIALTRAQMDSTSFSAAWAEGRALTLEKAVAYALE